VTEPVVTPEELARQAYTTAVRLLGSRDHSIAELRRKLGKREHDNASIDAAIEQLASANYVNDARFAERYAEQRMNQGYGPLSIRAKLTQRGVDSHWVQQALSSMDVTWSDHAETVILKRFNEQDICDTDQRITARIARFLNSRGFSSSDALRGLHQARRELSG